MDSPLWIRRMASERIMLISTVLILGHWSFWISCGIVFVTTTSSIADSSIRRGASEDSRPWVAMTKILYAPLSFRVSAAARKLSTSSMMSSCQKAGGECQGWEGFCKGGLRQTGQTAWWISCDKSAASFQCTQLARSHVAFAPSLSSLPHPEGYLLWHVHNLSSSSALTPLRNSSVPWYLFLSTSPNLFFCLKNYGQPTISPQSDKPRKQGW